MHFFMNEKVDIYMLKFVSDLHEKLIISVTEQNGPPLKAAGASRQHSGCSRWSRWWSSWTTFDGRPDRRGSVTVGARKGPHQVD